METTTMAYTITTTASAMHAFPTFESRDEAAQWARSQAKADLMSFGCTPGCDGRVEAEYTDQGENAAYVSIKNATRTLQGPQPQQTLSRVAIVEVV